jgi:hypothetical protein
MTDWSYDDVRGLLDTIRGCLSHDYGVETVPFADDDRAGLAPVAPSPRSLVVRRAAVEGGWTLSVGLQGDGERRTVFAVTLSPAMLRAAIQTAAAVFQPGYSGWSLTDAYRMVACPKCGAKAGDFCRTPKGRKAWPTHTERGAILHGKYGWEPWTLRPRGHEAVLVV